MIRAKFNEVVRHPRTTHLPEEVRPSGVVAAVNVQHYDVAPAEVFSIDGFEGFKKSSKESGMTIVNFGNGPNILSAVFKKTMPETLEILEVAEINAAKGEVKFADWTDITVTREEWVAMRPAPKHQGYL